MHEVREFAGHADIRTTEVYFVRSAQTEACLLNGLSGERSPKRLISHLR